MKLQRINHRVMRMNRVVFSLPFIILYCALQVDASNSKADLEIGKTYPQSQGHNYPDEISRKIDASKKYRPFPELVSYRNTSIQKAPAPILGELSEKSYGKAKITRCWLNLDEMWDYRSRQYDFDFKIGVDKYKGIPEKHRETWDWELESPITYQEYLKSFSDRSDDIMLTIRRYERDILDGTLPITREDWKIIFKSGLKHYKKLFPNIRFVEVCNEYGQKTFIGATSEEYYQFYKLGYEAVSEVNKELGLVGKDRILVGGPVATGPFIKRIDHFLKSYSQDRSIGKKMDFVSWHEYDQPIYQTVYREREVKDLLIKYGLDENTRLIDSEHDPYHFSEDKLEYHYKNAAGLVKSLYFSSLHSPNINIMPWVLYHNSKIQTRFMWFDGPNEPGTKMDEVRMLPIGCAMKLLSMHQGQEVLVDNSVVKEDLVLASTEPNRLVIEAVNYNTPRNVNLIIDNLEKVFPKLENEDLYVVKYLVDSKHSNNLSNPEYPGGIEKIEEFKIGVNEGKITLNHLKLEENGLVLWVITKGS